MNWLRMETGVILVWHAREAHVQQRSLQSQARELRALTSAMRLCETDFFILGAVDQDSFALQLPYCCHYLRERLDCVRTAGNRTTRVLSICIVYVLSTSSYIEYTPGTRDVGRRKHCCSLVWSGLEPPPTGHACAAKVASSRCALLLLVRGSPFSGRANKERLSG